MQHFIKSKSISIDCPDVRHEINSALKLAGSSCLTPYIGLERFRKILAPYSIFIPATGYMEGESGTRVFNVFQYNALSGENEHGDIVTKTESPYYIVFSYESCCGYYSVECKLVLKNELNESVNSKLKNLLNSERPPSNRPTEPKKKGRPILTDRFRKVRTYAIAQARAENSKKTLSELRLFFEENKHPLVLKVRQHNITDAWDAIKRRHGPHKPHGSKGEHEDIQKQLKSKGIKVSTAEIEKTIRDHQQKKKKRKKILEWLLEALSHEQLKKVYQLRKDGKYAAEIAQEMGMSYSSIHRHADSLENKAEHSEIYHPARHGSRPRKGERKSTIKLRDLTKKPRLRLSPPELNAAYEMRRQSHSEQDIATRMGYSKAVLSRELESPENKNHPEVNYHPAPSYSQLDKRKKKFNELMLDPDKLKSRIERLGTKKPEELSNVIGLSNHLTNRALKILGLSKPASKPHPPEVIAKVHDMRQNPAKHGLGTGSYGEIAYKMNTSGPEGSRKFTRGAVAGILGRGREKLK